MQLPNMCATTVNITEKIKQNNKETEMIQKVVFSIDKSSVKPFAVQCDKSEKHCPALSYMDLNGVSFCVKDKSVTRNVLIAPFDRAQLNSLFLHTIRNMCDCCKQK